MINQAFIENLYRNKFEIESQVEKLANDFKDHPQSVCRECNHSSGDKTAAEIRYLNGKLRQIDSVINNYFDTHK